MALVIGEIKPGFLDDTYQNVTMIPIPPPNGGAIGWGSVYVSFGCDFGDLLLRVAIYNTNGGWRISEVPVQAAGERVNVTIQDGDQKISVARLKASDADTGLWPAAWMIETILKP